LGAPGIDPSSPPPTPLKDTVTLPIAPDNDPRP